MPSIFHLQPRETCHIQTLSSGQRGTFNRVTSDTALPNSSLESQLLPFSTHLYFYLQGNRMRGFQSFKKGSLSFDNDTLWSDPVDIDEPCHQVPSTCLAFWMTLPKKRHLEIFWIRRSPMNRTTPNSLFLNGPDPPIKVWPPLPPALPPW